MAPTASFNRVVDISDLGVLAANWQGIDKTFSQGDFNHDGYGTVDLSDLGILATNRQKSLPVASQPATARLRSPTPVRAPTRSPIASPQLTAGKSRHSLVEEIELKLKLELLKPE